MKLAADMGRHSGRALPSLHDAPYRQIEEATGRQSTYPSPIAVQTNPATSPNHAQVDRACTSLRTRPLNNSPFTDMVMNLIRKRAYG